MGDAAYTDNIGVSCSQYLILN